MTANTSAECGNLTEIMYLKQEIRDFSYGTSFLMEHHLETKFNISSNSVRSEGEQDLIFHSEFRVRKFAV